MESESKPMIESTAKPKKGRPKQANQSVEHWCPSCNLSLRSSPAASLVCANCDIRMMLIPNGKEAFKRELHNAYHEIANLRKLNEVLLQQVPDQDEIIGKQEDI